MKNLTSYAKAVTFGVCVAVCHLLSAGVIYVAPELPEGSDGSGSSWANAMTSVSPDGRTLTVNGVAYARPNYVFRRVGSQYVMEIDPSVAVVRAIQTADGVVEIVPTSSVKGFWYQVEYSSTLNFADAKRTEPVEGTGEALSLTAPKGDGSLFYRLIVSDIDPLR